jgi:hypothetical protein
MHDRVTEGAELLVRAATAVALVLVCAVLAGCGGSGRKAPAKTAAAGAADRWGTVWLCRPGETPDPCASTSSATVIGPTGAMRIVRVAAPRRAPVDCFYVYPTISGQPTGNANLAIDLRLEEVATAQAAPFSQVCRVYAPVYRQITLAALDHPGRITLADALVAYRSVATAFRDYLLHYNEGRGVVLIGHSQGAAILIRLMEQTFDRSSLVRRRLVSALLLGGNVTVAKGHASGGSFAHIPACRTSRQTGCVVAYSSFTRKPSTLSEFGRATSDAGVRLLAPHHSMQGLQVLCVNPASPEGGTAPLEPAFPSLVVTLLGDPFPAVGTPWVAFRGRYTGRCESAGDATWLQVTATRPGGKVLLTRIQDPALGLHILDVNVALFDLVRLVRTEAAAYIAR